MDMFARARMFLIVPAIRGKMSSLRSSDDIPVAIFPPRGFGSILRFGKSRWGVLLSFRLFSPCASWEG